MRYLKSVFLSVAAILLLFGIAGAQNHLYGSSTLVASVGDVTGDGIPDFLNRTSLPFAPSAFNLLSGFNFTPIAFPFDPSTATAVGDLDGDGTKDVIFMTLTPNANLYDLTLRGYSIPTGQTLFLENFGPVAYDSFQSQQSIPRLIDVGDADGDGKDDFAVVMNAVVLSINLIAYPQDGFIRVYSGASRTLIFAEVVPILVNSALMPSNFSYYQPNAAESGPLGDVDADGNADFWTRRFTQFSSPAELALRHGPTGSSFFTVTSSFIRAAKLGDVDADGADDILYWDTGGSPSPVPMPMVGVLRGYDLEPLGVVVGSFFSGPIEVTALSDVDADGAPDFIVKGFPSFFSPQTARIFSGRTRQLILTHNGAVTAVGDAGDVNLDGRGDYLIGSNIYVTTGGVLTTIPLLSIWSPRSDHIVGSAVPFGPDFVQSSPSLQSTAPRFGATMVVSGTAPSASYGVLMISTPAAVPLMVDGGLMFDTPMPIWVDLSTVAVLGLNLQSSLSWNFFAAIPTILIAEGVQFTLQAAYWPTSGGFFATNAVACTLGI